MFPASFARLHGLQGRQEAADLHRAAGAGRIAFARRIGVHLPREPPRDPPKGRVESISYLDVNLFSSSKQSGVSYILDYIKYIIK